MSIDKFLQPRANDAGTVAIDVEFYDREIDDTLIFSGRFLKTTGKEFKKIMLDVLRANVGSEKSVKDSPDYSDELLSHMMQSASVNDTEIDREQFKKLVNRYPELGNYIDKEASKDAVFIKPQSGGSPSTSKPASNSKPRQRKAQKSA